MPKCTMHEQYKNNTVEGRIRTIALPLALFYHTIGLSKHFWILFYFLFIVLFLNEINKLRNYIRNKKRVEAGHNKMGAKHEGGI